MSVSTMLLSSNEIIMIKRHLDCFVIWLVIVVGTFHWAKGSTWTGNPALDHLKHYSQNCWFLLLNLMRLSLDAFIDQHHWDDNRHHHEIFLSSHESSETSVSALAALAVASIMGQHHHTNTTDIKEGENIKMALQGGWGGAKTKLALFFSGSRFPVQRTTNYFPRTVPHSMSTKETLMKNKLCFCC